MTCYQLLAGCVHASILGSVCVVEDLKQAMNTIIKLCNIQYSHALDLALANLKRLTLGKCSNMSEYINTAESLR
jgi:hypothetical protein